MMHEDNVIGVLLGQIHELLQQFPKVLERRAAEIQASGKDPDLAAKLVKGADAMRDGGHIYLSWARHYASLSEGQAEAAEEADEADFGT